MAIPIQLPTLARLPEPDGVVPRLWCVLDVMRAILINFSPRIQSGSGREDDQNKSLLEIGVNPVQRTGSLAIVKTATAAT